MTWNRPTKGRDRRNDFGVVGYVGANGGGKTACATFDSMASLDAGRPVLSTVRILDWRDPRPCDDEGCACPKDEPNRHRAAHPLWVPFTRWEQFMEWDFGDVIMDEVSGVASSRESHSMPGEVGTHLQQLRKGDVVVRWTAPSWKRADTIIRECSQIVINCKGSFSVEHKAADGEMPRRWRQRRMFLWTAYDAYAFEDFTVNARERLKPLFRDFHWGPGSDVFNAFDTYQKALSIGTVNQFGRCMQCGGRRSVPVCKGHDQELTLVPRTRPA